MLYNTAAHVVHEKENFWVVMRLWFAFRVFPSLSESRAKAEQHGTTKRKKAQNLS
jgi:hypothetical protein